MKKIKEIKKEKDSKRVQKVIIGGVIAFIMVFSILGFFSNQNNTQTKKLTYNGHKFTLTQNGLFLEEGKMTFHFNYYPTSLENVTYDRNIDTLLKNAKIIYITSDNKDIFVQQIGAIKYSFASQMSKMNRFVQNAFTTEVDGIKLPEITCANATQTTPVIYFSSTNETTMNLNNNCIILKSIDFSGFQSQIDRIQYGFLGIIK
jgi:hypothetical protein